MCNSSNDEAKAHLTTASGNRLLSVKEVCEILGISRTTLYLLFNEGKLRRLKVRNRTVVSDSALNDYVVNLSAQPEEL